MKNIYKKLQRHLVIILLINFFKNYKFKMSKLIANYMYKYGEVCIILTLLIKENKRKQENFEALRFFVKDIKTKEWKLFIYTGIEQEEDFKEFFLDFSKINASQD